MTRPTDQALVASPSSPQAVSTEGFDPSRIRRPTFQNRLGEFVALLSSNDLFAKRLAKGQQFNCYESAANSEAMDDDYREFRLCLGPITDAYYICDIYGQDNASLIEAALKLATEAFRDLLLDPSNVAQGGAA